MRRGYIIRKLLWVLWELVKRATAIRACSLYLSLLIQYISRLQNSRHNALRCQTLTPLAQHLSTPPYLHIASLCPFNLTNARIFLISFGSFSKHLRHPDYTQCSACHESWLGPLWESGKVFGAHYCLWLLLSFPGNLPVSPTGVTFKLILPDDPLQRTQTVWDEKQKHWQNPSNNSETATLGR